MKPSVIFDLDQTLIDTSSVETFRKSRDWTSAINRIPTLTPFDGINDLIKTLNVNSIEVIIITKSPGHYCSAIVKYFKWQITGQICYHDVRPDIKPHPAAFLKAIKDYDLDVSKTISVGDSDIDIVASTSAKIPSIACTWASPAPQALLASNPTYVAKNPVELTSILSGFFYLND